MQELTDIVAHYVREKYATGTVWYTWAFKPEDVPAGVEARGADWYARNVALKQELNARWRAQPAHRAELERYYVADWGGVRSNRPATLALYHGSDARTNIARGDKGIASWSKALCVRDPHAFAIFDARVSASLNALQVIHRVAAPLRFPLLASRNREVAMGSALLRRHFQQHAWPGVDKGFYDTYLGLCRAVGKRIGPAGASMPVYAAEMALFAHTEELLRKAFPEAA